VLGSGLLGADNSSTTIVLPAGLEVKTNVYFGGVTETALRGWKGAAFTRKYWQCHVWQPQLGEARPVRVLTLHPKRKNASPNVVLLTGC